VRVSALGVSLPNFPWISGVGDSGWWGAGSLAPQIAAPRRISGRARCVFLPPAAIAVIRGFARVNPGPRCAFLGGISQCEIAFALSWDPRSLDAAAASASLAVCYMPKLIWVLIEIRS
jgi:hypothetical protein